VKNLPNFIRRALWIYLSTFHFLPASGQDFSTLKAEELLIRGRSAFDNRDYPTAVAAYSHFIQFYGTIPEGRLEITRASYQLGIALVNLGRFEEAIPFLKASLDSPGENQPAQIQNMTFWLGVAQLQEKNYAEARTALEKFIAIFPPDSEKNPLFIRQNPAAALIPEARTTIGTTYILEGKFQEAADYYAQLKPTLPPHARGRAVIFQLYALEQLGDFDGAMKVVTEEYPHMGDIAQLISFQTLTLRLGNHWLERGEFRKTIQCLQRVWPFDRLIKHQENRLVALKSKLKAAEANTGDPYAKILYSRLVGEVSRELENFRKVENFDSALIFRQAIAYQQMRRYREAALLLEKISTTYSGESLSEQAGFEAIRCWQELSDWRNTLRAAEYFLKTFPKSKRAHDAESLKNDAARKLEIGIQ